MTDLDTTLRNAIGAAAAVPPPFAEIERRHRARRTRRAAALGAVSVVAGAVTALAVPYVGRGTGDNASSGGGAPKPWGAALKDERALDAIRDCVDARLHALAGATPGSETAGFGDVAARCFRENGFHAPPAGYVLPPRQPGPLASQAPRDSGFYLCGLRPPATGTTPVGAGVRDGIRWSVVTWEGNDGVRCTSWQSTPAVPDRLDGDDANGSGAVGSFEPGLSWATVRSTPTALWTVFWGALDPDVATMRVKTNTGTYEAETVRIEETQDRVYVGLVVKNAGPSLLARTSFFDAAGRELTGRNYH